MLKSGILIATLVASSTVASAQPTTAGGQLQQIPPPPVAPKSTLEFEAKPPATPAETGPPGPAVRVERLRVSGAAVFDEPTLLAASGFRPGSELSLSQLRTIAARISAFYHARGYFLAQAYLPAQDVQSGSVTIEVIEGRYGAVGVDNQTNLSDRVARGVLSGLDSGDIVAVEPLERRMLLLSDLPGVRVKSVLSPGAAVGTSDLSVNLMPGRRVTGSLEADNAGNRLTGRHRLGGTVNLNNPAGIGDQLSLRVLASTDGLAYGRAAYQAPLGNLTLGVAYAHVRYELGREFESLDADGTADIASVYASYPLIRSREANLYAQGSLEGKWFEDRIGLVSTKSNKKSRVATVGLSGDAHDDFGGGGWTNVYAGWIHGDLDIQSRLERAADALTARTDGTFNKLELASARLQTIGGPLALYASIRGQIAFDNLDNSEKMELGGAYGVRAYPEGEAYGDEGYVATFEARLALARWMSFVPGRLEAIGFVDVGQVDFAHDPWFAGNNRSRRSAIGAGLNWLGPEGFVVRGSYAHRLGDAVVTSGPDRDGRFLFQIIKVF